MSAVLLLCALIQPIAGSIFPFSKTSIGNRCSASGSQCNATLPCCKAGALDPGPDHCEAVNKFYSKCVMQPTCAKDDSQCKGKGDSVMEPTACCTSGFVCKEVNDWYSHCVNASAPPPAPSPTPAPHPTCAETGNQCGGSGFHPIGCCDTNSECEVVDEFYSKCVDQPKCVAENALCGGHGGHVMKPTACCNSSTTCVPWGSEWSVCRAHGHETCSVHGEQCAGTGGSAMPLKSCCDPADECVFVNKWYSKCDTKARPLEEKEEAPLAHPCPGLQHCPSMGDD